MDKLAEKSINDMCCEILQKTNDGNGLDPVHLKMIQDVVNFGLTEEGEIIFYDFHKTVMDGNYKKPWLHGVEHLTRNHNGYVFWKGIEVEHYSFYSEDGYQREEAAAIELGRRCRLLESRGITPMTNTAIWTWKDGE